MKGRRVAAIIAVGFALMVLPEMKTTLDYPRFLLTFLYFVFLGIAGNKLEHPDWLFRLLQLRARGVLRHWRVYHRQPCHQN